MPISELDGRILHGLQAGIPLCSRPFAALGQRWGLAESEVIDRIELFRQQGIVRRVGGVFNAVQFGYQSALCGIAIPANQIDSVVATLVPHPGITHCYTRSARSDGSVEPICIQEKIPVPNLWFTLSVPSSEFAKQVEQLQANIPYPIRVAPATHRFKVQVVLDPSALGNPEKSGIPEEIPLQGTEIVTPNSWEKCLLRFVQKEIPLVPEPWQAIATTIGASEELVLRTLGNWQQIGALRRIALLARHQKMGFQSNAMCTWDIPKERVETSGLLLAGRREITHCYERSTFPGFPYNVFAMIHSDTESSIRNLAHHLSELIAQPLGLLFVSVQEYKKTSLVLFSE